MVNNDSLLNIRYDAQKLRKLLKITKITEKHEILQKYNTEKY